MLAEHPDVASRLRQEVLDTVGPTDRPNYEHIKEMKFMRAFINGLSNDFGCFDGSDHCFRGSAAVPACVRSLRHGVNVADVLFQSI